MRNRMPLRRNSPRRPIGSFIHTVESPPDGGSFDLLPSELALGKAVKNPQGVDYALEKALRSIKNPYDYVIIDCAPTDSVLTATALMAADYILVPVRPDRFSILGYGGILEAIDEFREVYPDPHCVRDLGVVFTQVNGENSIQEQCMKDVRKQASYVFRNDAPILEELLAGC